MRLTPPAVFVPPVRGVRFLFVFVGQMRLQHALLVSVLALLMIASYGDLLAHLVPMPGMKRAEVFFSHPLGLVALFTVAPLIQIPLCQWAFLRVLREWAGWPHAVVIPLSALLFAALAGRSWMERGLSFFAGLVLTFVYAARRSGQGHHFLITYLTCFVYHAILFGAYLAGMR